ncbi:T3SS effector HopA1 family protein [Moorena sp. SIO4G3]|uniref:T3SS effector HopA1 family protein n=1 Tax=Moorena sp. SIO4G3 TaxID=2607821 RepID=UPI0034302DDC
MSIFSPNWLIMPLLNSLRNQLPDSSPDSAVARELDILEDIVSNLQIQPNFCISHRDYKPLELSAEMLDRVQQLPVEIQNKYLSLQLLSFLYDIYDNGFDKATESAQANSTDLPLHPNVENNTVMGLNLEFYQQLYESNTGTGYFEPGWLVIREESYGKLAVHKNGLTLHIRPEYYLPPGAQSATVGTLVAIRMPPNLVEHGFYVAVGNAGPVNAGPVNQNIRDRDYQIVNVYFNLSPEGAVALIRAITEELNEITIPFTFKVVDDPANYDRYDSGVLCFEKSNYETVHPILESVYAQHQSHFEMEVPLFTKQLAPGLALSEEPVHKFTAEESFRMNRWQMVANGLLEVWQNGKDSPEGRINSIQQQFSQFGIELRRPYLNADSEDIYRKI